MICFVFFFLTLTVKEDFIDQHTVSSIKEKLPHVMPVSCYRLGIDGANIVFQSKVSVFIFGTEADQDEESVRESIC